MGHREAAQVVARHVAEVGHQREVRGPEAPCARDGDHGDAGLDARPKQPSVARLGADSRGGEHVDEAEGQENQGRHQRHPRSLAVEQQRREGHQESPDGPDVLGVGILLEADGGAEELGVLLAAGPKREGRDGDEGPRALMLEEGELGVHQPTPPLVPSGRAANQALELGEAEEGHGTERDLGGEQVGDARHEGVERNRQRPEVAPGAVGQVGRQGDAADLELGYGGEVEVERVERPYEEGNREANPHDAVGPELAAAGDVERDVDGGEGELLVVDPLAADDGR